MKKIIRTFLFSITCVILISACGANGFEGEAYTSERFGYSIMYPTGWLVKDKDGEWPEYEPVDPNRVSGVDAFAGYVDGRNLAIGVGARELADTDLNTWVETAKSVIKTGAGRGGICNETVEDDPVSQEAITLAGEPAVLLEYRCRTEIDSFGLVALSIHEGKGYWITWISAQGNEEADKAQFLQVLSSFAFIQ